MGHDLTRLSALTDDLLAGFQAAGAVRVEPPALLDAETLLDLYGEDIRTRAYTTHDPAEGERMLRPDFTVPVVEMHTAMGQEPARYCYAGPVWRRQEPGSDRPTEYRQVGYELFDRGDEAAADAEVFALIAAALHGRGLTVATGDMGVLRAAVSALDISERRRAALMRHIWRPARFRKLVERFAAPMAMTEARARLLDAAREGEGAVAALIKQAAPVQGVRARAEIIARAMALKEASEEPPLTAADRALLDQVTGLAGTVASAAGAVRAMARAHAGMDAAADRLTRRAAALAARGLDPATLPFAAQFGRTTLEYYDGFVFGFVDEARPDLPPIASGGRYDALTAALSGGAGIPAVGGIIRPEVLLAREGS
nr:ATP phosphoribosyltransferase regulatory subunit [Rubricella aquisinus]